MTSRCKRCNRTFGSNQALTQHQRSCNQPKKGLGKRATAAIACSPAVAKRELPLMNRPASSAIDVKREPRLRDGLPVQNHGPTLDAPAILRIALHNRK